MVWLHADAKGCHLIWSSRNNTPPHCGGTRTYISTGLCRLCRISVRRRMWVNSWWYQQLKGQTGSCFRWVKFLCKMVKGDCRRVQDGTRQNKSGEARGIKLKYIKYGGLESTTAVGWWFQKGHKMQETERERRNNRKLPEASRFQTRTNSLFSWWKLAFAQTTRK